MNFGAARTEVIRMVPREERNQDNYDRGYEDGRSGEEREDTQGEYYNEGYNDGELASECYDSKEHREECERNFNDE
jgi:hypothetical protein